VPSMAYLREKGFRRSLLMLFGACLACYGVFFLPYRFPTKIPTYSHSYVAGYSNRVAAIASVVLAIVIFGLSRLLSRGKPRRPAPASELSRNYLYWCGTVYAAVIGTLCFEAWRSPDYYGEAAYFLLRLDRMLNAGQMPYRDFDLAYGWVQLYFPASIYWLLHPLHVSMEVSYYFAVLVMNLCGLVLLFRVVNDRTLNIGPKGTVFILTALAMLNVTLGLNYTAVRFLTAPCLLLLLRRQRAIVTLGATVALSSILAWSIAPEAGVAYAAASTCFLAISAARKDRRLLFLLPFSALGFPIMLGIFGLNYISAMLDFSAGMANFLIVPAPYILLFLLTLLCIVAVGLATVVRDDCEGTPLLLSLAVMGLVYVNAALGRCDPGHVLWNGICIFILGFALMAKYYTEWMYPYLAAFALLYVVGLHVGVERTYSSQFDLLGAADSAEYEFSLARLESIDTVAAPLMLDKRTQAYLSTHGKLARDPFVLMTYVFDPKSLDIKLRALAASPYVLADLDDCCNEDSRKLVETIMLFPLRYQPRNEPFSPGKRLRSFVETNFEKVDEVGPYNLYRNLRHLR
jgi:hypothetical protein